MHNGDDSMVYYLRKSILWTSHGLTDWAPPEEINGQGANHDHSALRGFQLL